MNLVGTEIQAVFVATVALLAVANGMVAGPTGQTKVVAVGKFKAKKSVLTEPRNPI